MADKLNASKDGRSRTNNISNEENPYQLEKYFVGNIVSDTTPPFYYADGSASSSEEEESTDKTNQALQDLHSSIHDCSIISGSQQEENKPLTDATSPLLTATRQSKD